MNYQTGFGNELATEAPPEALPVWPRLTPFALETPRLQGGYFECMQGLKKHFRLRSEVVAWNKTNRVHFQKMERAACPKFIRQRTLT